MILSINKTIYILKCLSLFQILKMLNEECDVDTWTVPKNLDVLHVIVIGYERNKVKGRKSSNRWLLPPYPPSPPPPTLPYPLCPL